LWKPVCSPTAQLPKIAREKAALEALDGIVILVGLECSNVKGLRWLLLLPLLQVGIC
jgi:hypothetical protein